jgi:hypothetical protein
MSGPCSIQGSYHQSLVLKPVFAKNKLMDSKLLLPLELHSPYQQCPGVSFWIPLVPEEEAVKCIEETLDG